MQVQIPMIVYDYVKPAIEEHIQEDTAFLAVDFDTFIRLTNLSNVTVLDYDYKFEHREQANIADAIYRYNGKDIKVFCIKSNALLYHFCMAGDEEMLNTFENGALAFVK